MPSADIRPVFPSLNSILPPSTQPPSFPEFVEQMCRRILTGLAIPADRFFTNVRSQSMETQDATGGTPAVVARNAAGVPLTLVGAPAEAGDQVTIDWSGIPAGINGKSYTSEELTALSTADRQSVLDQLVEKYDGVSVDEGAGTKVYSFEFMLAPADLAVYEELLALGAQVAKAKSDEPTHAASKSTDAQRGSAAGDPAEKSAESGAAASETDAAKDGQSSTAGESTSSTTGTADVTSKLTTFDSTTHAVVPHGHFEWLRNLLDHLEKEGCEIWHETVAEGRTLFSLAKSK